MMGANSVQLVARKRRTKAQDRGWQRPAGETLERDAGACAVNGR